MLRSKTRRADLTTSYCPGGPDSDFEYSTQSYTVRLLAPLTAPGT